MLTVKICRSASEIRRLQIPNQSGNLFRAISEVASSSYKVSVAEIRLSYQDDDGDWCLVASEEEMLEAIRFFREEGKKVLKFRMTHSEPEAKEPEAKEPEAKEPEAKEPEAKEPEAKGPSVAFVADVTLPDGCEARGAVQKTWRVKNNGSVQWPTGCFLEGQDTKLPVRALLPGEEIDLTLDLNLPNIAGQYKKEYVLMSDPSMSGDTNLWVILNVVLPTKPSAMFVKDISLADNADLAPNQWVTKTWAFKNDGKESWPANSNLVFKTGRLMPRTRQIPLPETKAGETVNISVQLRTPPRPGRHSAIFTLTSPDGTAFDNHCEAWCHARVRPAISKSDFLWALPKMLENAEVRSEVEKLLGLPPSHEGIHCDACGATPLRGIRFKCTVCPDFDLCADCESKGNHPSSHAMIKLRQPVPVKKAQARKTEVKASKKYSATFVDDITIPDGIKVAPGSTVRKTWRVKNSGAVAWPEGSKLSWVNGALKGACTPVACAPGAEVDISVDINIPETPGRYSGHFRIASSSGEKFGDKYFLDVIVDQGEMKRDIVTEIKTKKATNKKHERKVVKKAEKQMAKQVKRAEKQAAKLIAKQTKQSKALFIADVSVPDGSSVQADTVLTKTWRVKNSGAVAWPEGSKLSWVNGALKGACTPVACAPGAEVDISVDIKIPANKLGKLVGKFRLIAPSGRRFGDKLWVEVVVEEKQEQQVVEPNAEQINADESNINSLVAMGFEDRAMLRSLLGAANGNVAVVAGWLLARN